MTKEERLGVLAGVVSIVFVSFVLIHQNKKLKSELSMCLNSKE